MTSVGDEFVDTKYGEALKYDPEFTGPVKNRSCTDILCLFLFLAFIGGWAVVAGFAYKEGRPELLLHPTDSYGNICGINKFEKQPYLFFFDLATCAKSNVVISGCATPQICVSECPTKTFVATSSTSKEDLICIYEKNANFESVKNGNCANIYLKSAPVAGRCLPVNLTFVGENVTDIEGNVINFTKGKLGIGGNNLARFLNARAIGEQIFQDFSAAWWLIILFLIASMMVSLIWILLMRWIAGFMVYLSIVFVIAVLGFVSGFSFYSYYYLKNDLPPQDNIFKNSFTDNLNTYSHSTTTWLAVGIIFGVVWAILVLMLIFLRKRIVLAIALIREGSKAVGCITSSLFFPLVPYAMQLLVFVFWGSIAVCIASAPRGAEYKSISIENSTYSDEPCDMSNIQNGPKCQFTKYLKDDNLPRAQIYNLFGFFWAMFFCVGIGQVSLAGAFASYYWSANKSDLPTFAVLSSMGRTFRYHLGSIAFGSLIISIVRMIRVALEYIDNKCKKYNNPFTKCLILCCKCCFWCLEKFMRFISKNAYIMMSIYGKNFCSSAREAFKLLMRNVARVVVLDKVTDYLLLLGKLVVVGLTAIAAFFFFSGKVKYFVHYSPELNYYFLPVITVTIGGYLISTGFFNVYSMAVDTLFLSFLEDCERNDGSPERPYRMSKELMKILGKKNKLQDQQR